MENVEELVPLYEIQPLPPLPVEEGLEMLPAADEARRGDETAPLTASDDYRSPIPRGDYEPEEPDSSQGSGGGMIFARTTDLAELEELEALDEEAGAPDAAPIPAGSDNVQESELALLVSSGKIAALTMEELGALVEEGASSVVMENGVFRIKEEVYTGGDQAPGNRADNQLRELAQEVVEHAERESTDAGAPLEATGMGGIGELLRDEDTLDLSQDVSSEKGLSMESSLSIDREKSNPIRLKRNGLDYDEFLSSYPRSFTHTTQMKSLVEVSRRVSAVSAGLFMKKSDGFVPDLTIGLSEKSVSACTFAPSDPLYSGYFLSRKAVAINRNPAEIRFLNIRFDQEDIRYMKRMLFIPSVFRNQEAYLLLSFSGETDISINSVLSMLIVR